MSGSSNKNGIGIWLILVTLESDITASIQKNNDKVEYKALIAGLNLAKALRTQQIDCFNDS